MATEATQQKAINLFDFSGGIVNRRENPLSYPPNCLLDGENFDVSDKWLKTRAGHVGASDAITASGVVTSLHQIYFPTNEVSYLLAQVEVASTSNKLWISSTSLPSTSVAWSELYDLGVGAGTVSVAVLNDRAVITEGVTKAPLVFLGGLTSTGADWAVPKNVLVAETGTDLRDISDTVCDSDSTTATALSAFPTAGKIYVNFDVPTTSGLYIQIDDANTATATLTVERYVNGTWTGVTVTDNTAVTGKSLAQSGTVTWTAVATDYSTISEIAGYWIRLSWNFAATGNVDIARILFDAPCQALANIGSGVPDNPLGFWWYDSSVPAYADWSVEVMDNSFETYGLLQTMTTGDYFFVGCLTPFHAILIKPGYEYANTQASVLSAKYWNGTTWASVTITDTTAVGGATLYQPGLVSWAIPTAWVENTPLADAMPFGYWIRFQVSATLDDWIHIDECRVQPAPKALVKHKYVGTVGNRIALANRPDARDQIDVSRPYEEYAFNGTTSISQRIGNLGAVRGMIEIFGVLWVWKDEDWYAFDPEATPNFIRLEAAGQVPINQQSVIRAPIVQYSQGDIQQGAEVVNTQGVYFINQSGAWNLTAGDNGRIVKVSQNVNWWDADAENPKLDLSYLYKSCGVYWPEKHRVLWSVPMITGVSASQATLNRIIGLDITSGAWMPPYTIATSALCPASVYNANAPGKRGTWALYGANYTGELIRLFGEDQTTDDGTAIACWVETGWLNFGAPGTEKLIRNVFSWGKTTGSVVRIRVYVDGSDYPTNYSTTQLSDVTGAEFTTEFLHRNIQGRHFKFRIEITGVSELYGLQILAEALRDWQLSA
jgi:hypothetical protein